jgi:hypothetical protein
MYRLRVDGSSCEVPEGGTVLDALRVIGIRLPALCHPAADHPAQCRHQSPSRPCGQHAGVQGDGGPDRAYTRFLMSNTSTILRAAASSGV